MRQLIRASMAMATVALMLSAVSSTRILLGFWKIFHKQRFADSGGAKTQEKSTTSVEQCSESSVGRFITTRSSASMWSSLSKGFAEYSSQLPLPGALVLLIKHSQVEPSKVVAYISLSCNVFIQSIKNNAIQNEGLHQYQTLHRPPPSLNTKYRCPDRVLNQKARTYQCLSPNGHYDVCSLKS
uniref:Uncharacterized protein n=1 Tax=Cucumis melo TaxID=3656 RepID=A0A9I9E5F5_CUCME